MIHLHIGRHKTGTTAIQNFLALNRDALAHRGFRYPEPRDGTIAHHALARTLDPRPTQPGGVVKPLDPAEVERFAGLPRQDGHLIVSSERFQSADPQVVRDLWPDQEVRVVVYVREPLAYMLSSYAQEVHARCIRTPLVAHAAHFRLDYAAFVGRWAEVFGADAIQLRVYEREQLLEGDVRQDFCRVLGIDPEGLEFSPEDPNPTLCPELIEFKGLVNAVVPLERQTAMRLYRVLSRTAAGFAGRIQPGPAFAEAYRGPTRAANSRMLQRFGAGRLQPFREPVVARPTPPLDLQDVRDRMLEAVIEASPGRGRALAKALPKDVSDFDPLLPHDWDEAGAQLQAVWGASAA